MFLNICGVETYRKTFARFDCQRQWNFIIIRSSCQLANICKYISRVENFYSKFSISFMCERNNSIFLYPTWMRESQFYFCNIIPQTKRCLHKMSIISLSENSPCIEFKTPCLTIIHRPRIPKSTHVSYFPLFQPRLLIETHSSQA